VFSSVGSGIFQARADGARQPQPLTQSTTTQFPGSFTPDGKRLVYDEVAGGTQIWTVPLEDEGGQLKAGKPELFLKSDFRAQRPSFSPDGRWLAYQSNESGEVYVRAFPQPSSGQGGNWQISNNGGTTPRWSRNGRELVYRSGDQIMAVSYTANGDTFVAEKTRVWITKARRDGVGSGPGRQARGRADLGGIRGLAPPGTRGRVPPELLRRAAAPRAARQVTSAWRMPSLRRQISPPWSRRVYPAAASGRASRCVRPVAKSSRSVVSLVGIQSKIRSFCELRSCEVWRARQDSNLRPPA
jgi:hypothetical protein